MDVVVQIAEVADLVVHTAVKERVENKQFAHEAAQNTDLVHTVRFVVLAG